MKSTGNELHVRIWAVFERVRFGRQVTTLAISPAKRKGERIELGTKGREGRREGGNFPVNLWRREKQ